MGRKKSKPANGTAQPALAPTHYDVDQVKLYARGQWASILATVGGCDIDLLDGNHHHCPKCGGTDRFRFTNLDDDGSLICNQCGRTGDGMASLIWLTGLKFADVLKLVADHLGIAPTLHALPGSNPNGKSSIGKFNNADPAEHLKFFPWNEGTEAAAKLWCLHKPPITLAAILAVGGQVARYRDKYTVIALPIWGSDWRDTDAPARPAKPCGYSLYEISGHTLPKWGKKKPDGTFDPPEQVKVKLTFGSKPGIIADRSRLAAETTTSVWKVEGPSDLLAFLSLPDLPADVGAMTNANGAGEQPHAWMVEIFAEKTARCCHDADEPGQKGAIAATPADRPGWANFIAATATEAKNVLLPFPIEKNHGKDLRDYTNSGGNYTSLAALSELSQPIPPAAAADAPLQPSQQKPIEDDDDPHRLARVNLEYYAAQADGATIRYWREEWYTWKPSRACYRTIKEKEFRAKLTQSIKAEFDRQWAEDMARYEEETKKPDYDWDNDKGPPKARKVTGHLVTNVLAATAGLTLVPSSVELMTWLGDCGSIRERRQYIAMKNGRIDLDKLLADADADECIHPHSPNWFSTVRLPYDFDPDAKCPKWEAFLEKNLELDPERIKILQEWAGYCLTPDTGQQKFLAMEGEGSNGKSVYCAALAGMLGMENCSHIPLERFAGDSFDGSETLGKLINICADVGEIDRLAEGNLKSFTSGDVMSFKRKFISNIACIPTARLILSFNNRPRFSDRSQGIWRRMLLIPWNVQITEAERVPNMDKAWWWEKQGELPGIFLWALRGLHRLQAQGRFTESSVGKDALEDYRDEANPARCFLKENLEPSDSSVRCSLIYHFYAKWCERTGHRPMSDRVFGKEIKRVFSKCERKRARYGNSFHWNYCGIAFSQEEIFGERTSDSELF